MGNKRELQLQSIKQYEPHVGRELKINSQLILEIPESSSFMSQYSYYGTNIILNHLKYLPLQYEEYSLLPDVKEFRKASNKTKKAWLKDYACHYLYDHPIMEMYERDKNLASNNNVEETSYAFEWDNTNKRILIHQLKNYFNVSEPHGGLVEFCWKLSQDNVHSEKMLNFLYQSSLMFRTMFMNEKLPEVYGFDVHELKLSNSEGKKLCYLLQELWNLVIEKDEYITYRNFFPEPLSHLNFEKDPSDVIFYMFLSMISDPLSIGPWINQLPKKYLTNYNASEWKKSYHNNGTVMGVQLLSSLIKNHFNFSNSAGILLYVFNTGNKPKNIDWKNYTLESSSKKNKPNEYMVKQPLQIENNNKNIHQKAFKNDDFSIIELPLKKEEKDMSKKNKKNKAIFPESLEPSLALLHSDGPDLLMRGNAIIPMLNREITTYGKNPLRMEEEESALVFNKKLMEDEFVNVARDDLHRVSTALQELRSVTELFESSTLPGLREQLSQSQEVTDIITTMSKLMTEVEEGIRERHLKRIKKSGETLQKLNDTYMNDDSITLMINNNVTNTEAQETEENLVDHE